MASRWGVRARRGVVGAAAALVLVSGTAAIVPAWATPQPVPVSLTATQHEDLRRIQTYLNDVRAVQARFDQTSSTGDRARGTVYMLRPGKLRIEYDAPSPLLIVADGNLIYYYDRQINQVNYVPIGTTPAGLLLDNRIKLEGGDVTVTDFAQDENEIRITMTRTASPGDGSLTLVFDAYPFGLREWRVLDAQGVMTTVALSDTQIGARFDSGLFKFDPSRLPGRRD